MNERQSFLLFIPHSSFIAHRFRCVACDCKLVFNFLQEPERFSFLFAPFHLEESPFALQSLAIKSKTQRAFAPIFKRRISFGRLKRSNVPAIDLPCSVMPFAYLACEGQIRDGVIFNFNG